MKKIVIFLPVIIMAVFTLSGCAGNGDLKTSVIEVKTPSESTKSVADCGVRGIDRESLIAWKSCMKEIRK